MILLVGVLIGLVLGLTGAGGSVFAVPLLLLVVALPMSEVVGLALGAVAASALYGSVRNGNQHLVLWVPAILLGIGGVLFVPLGKWLGNQLPEFWLLLGFNVLAIALALRMWLGARCNPEEARVLRVNTGRREQKPLPNSTLCCLGPQGQVQLRPCGVCLLVVGGAVVGLLSGLFGVGGGFLIVPLLLILRHVDMAQAVATSLVIISAVSGTGFVSHLLLNGVDTDYKLLAQIVVGGVAGMILGQLVSHRIDGSRLQQIFAVSLVLVSLGSLISSLI